VSRVYSTLFFHGVAPSPTPEIVYEVPDGYLAILRDVDMVSNSATATYMKISELVADLDVLVLQVPAIPAPAGAQWTGRQVFTPGMQIGGYANGDLVVIRLGGYLLELP
jgi:hypothetical protein